MPRSTPTRLAPAGLAGLVLTLLAGCAAEPAPIGTVRLMPAAPESIEVSAAPSVLGPIALAEIVIEAEDADAAAPMDVEADRVAAAPTATDAWLAAMSASAAPTPRASTSAGYGASGGGVGLAAYASTGDLAPVRKSFGTRGPSAPVAGGMASVVLKGSGGGATRGLARREAAGPREAVSPAVIKQTVQAQAGRLRACYERALKTDERLAGRLVLAFSVQPDGGVRGAKVQADELGSAKVAGCVVDAVAALRFPEGSEAVAVEYPVSFRPDGAW